MSDTEILTKHCFHDGVITKSEYCGETSSLLIEGDFPEDETEHSGLKYFRFIFSDISESTENSISADISDFDILDFEILNEKEKYNVKLCLENNMQFICMKFACKNTDCCLGVEK